MACLATVRQLGYQLVAEHSVEESCSGDGLIVARSERAPDISAVKITKNIGTGRVRENVASLTDLLGSSDHRRLWKAVRTGRFS